MRSILLPIAIVTICGNFAYADSDKTIPTGYILSIWFGHGYGQTQSFSVFEGAFAKERCDSAREVLKSHLSNGFGGTVIDDWAKCLPFDIDIPYDGQTN